MAVCAACGNTMAPEDSFCRRCGRVSGSAAPSALPQQPISPPETSAKAIISLICGLAFFVPLAFIAAIVFGHLALSEIKKSAGRLKGQGMAIAGLVLGYLWIAGIPIMLIIAAIAIPNLLRARMAANESSAVADIRTINVAEVSYVTSHPFAGYTCSLADLQNDRLINEHLATGEKSGYRFELQNCVSESSGPKVKYQVVAYPRVANQSGIRAFCSDESAVIRVDSRGVAQACLENGSPLQ